MRFVTLGSTSEIGASCHFLSIDKTGFILDAGADPNQEGPSSLPPFETIRSLHNGDVNHVFITHTHHDHIGSLPILAEHFPEALIHLPQASRELADYVLRASARLQERKYYEGSSLHPPLFNKEDLEIISPLFVTHDFSVPFHLPTHQDTLTAQFFYSGHILGAAGVLLSFNEQGKHRQVFYTSDTNLQAQSIIPGGEYPQGPIDVLILETTLGADADAELTTRQAEEKRFCQALQQVLDKGGTVLIPVFVLGRAQEILALIDQFKKQGHICADVPVYTAGGMRAIAEIYDATRQTTPRLNANFEVYGVDQLRPPRGQQAKRRILQKPGIHVAASGMMFENTLSNWIAQHLVEDEQNAIFLVGFAKEDSPAGRLLEAMHTGGDGILLDPRAGMQPLACEVQRFRFSGHSHRRELIQLVGMLKPHKVVLLHGETEARKWMADNIRDLYPHVELVLPQMGIPLGI